MNNPLSISTGFIYKLIPDDGLFHDTAASYLKNFNIDGLEFHYSSKRLVNNKFSNVVKGFIDSLNFNTIHSPDGGLITDEELDLLEKEYKLTNSKFVVFHEPSIRDFSRLESYSFKSLVENEDYRKNYNTKPKDIASLLKKYDIGFVFDFAHALSISEGLVSDFLTNLGDQIYEVHISFINKEKGHEFIYDKSLDNLIRKLPSNVPLINESVIWNLDDINLFHNEINYLRNV